METVNGDRTVRYEIVGSGHRVIVLLPALGATTEMWRPQMEALSDYTLVLCETGGHYPAGTGESRLADYAADTFAVMDAIGVGEADVVGLSMGGMVAQEMALAAPDRIASLVLAATVARYPEERGQAMRDRAHVVEREGMRAVVDEIVTRWLTEAFRERDPMVTDSIHAMLSTADAESYAVAARAVAEVDTLSRLGDIACRVMVIYGDRDASLPEGAEDALAAGISRSETVCLPEAAHLCNLEATSGFNRALLRFLQASPTDWETRPLSPW